MPAPEKHRPPGRNPPAPPRSAPARPAPAAPEPKPPPPARELGWYPDCVFTGDKFERDVAFFADALGRISRFSREPADLALARRLPGQAALPGLINAHSHAYQRTLRGRAEQRVRAGSEPLANWREAHDRAAGRLTPEDMFDVARMAFMEMLLAGVTCVGEFHLLHRQPDGTPYDEAGLLAREVVRAAHDVGLRIALLPAARTRPGFGQPAGSVPARTAMPADQFVRYCDSLRTFVAANFPADEAWVGMAADTLGAVPLDGLKAIAGYAHTQRLRLHAHVGTSPEEAAACAAEYGRPPIRLLVEHGILDKRFTAVDAIHVADDEVSALGAARASVVVAPNSEHNFGLGVAPIGKLLAAGAAVALGTDSQVEIDLLRAARLLEYRLRGAHAVRGVIAPDPSVALLHAATVAGARSLGATGGGLEVGRPADFFTVGLFDPSIAGAEPDALLGNILFALERRAIREVWVGARQRISGGRHALQGPIIGRFVDLQRRLWE